MNKSELKEFVDLLYDGNAPCDTDKLVDDMRELLSEYDHRNSEHGVCTALCTYFKNKKSEIMLLAKHPKYIGEMRAVVSIEIPRTSDLTYKCGLISEICRLGTNIETRVDKTGKRIYDYVNVGKKTVSVSDIKNGDEKSIVTIDTDAMSNFLPDGRTKESAQIAKSFALDIPKFSIMGTTLSVEDLSAFDNYKEMHLHVGEKTTRAMRKVCEFYGVTTENDEMGNAKVDDEGKKIPSKQFEVAYAKYTASMITNTRNMIMYVSLNPLDYLTMSFGNSWASCHTIDKENKRKMQNGYSGMYCGGTLSYMLDKVSFITFLHDKKPDDIVNDGKIYRCMFHFYEPKQVLVQGRVYPQGNDGATDLYKIIRNKMQSVLSECMGVPNKWVKSSTSPEDYDGIHSDGVHYRDYCHFDDCNVSYVSGRDCTLDDDEFTIGHDGICLYCGSRISDNGRLSHATCTY